mmetsp:Transcript_29335/g.43268  ORF Transcript_29335/g.43268 Transcript_29335/m.43268 type:complete len:426 (-) Transcript_29335:1312-2589(-)
MISTTSSLKATTEQQFKHLPPPSSHIGSCCLAEWNTARARIGHTVFGLSWHGEFLAGCTSAGEILVWLVPFAREEDDIDELLDDEKWSQSGQERSTFTSKTNSRKPAIKFQASPNNGMLYSIKFLHVQKSLLLGVSGDDGILLYSWDDVQALTIDPSKTPEPKHHFKPPSLHPKMEINDFDIDDDLNIFGASEVGCKWNIESGKLSCSYASSKNGYLHTIKVLPSSTFQGGHSIMLMGGEDGTLGVWDKKCDRLIEHVNIKARMNEDTSLSHSCLPSTMDQDAFNSWKQHDHLWISHMEASESCNWWNLCGGAEDNMGRNFGGHLTCWHAPTRSLAAGCTTRETPSYIARQPSSSVMATIANESVVSYWSAAQLEREKRSWTTSPCSYALAIRESDSVTAVGGVGSRVDILNERGSKLYSVSTLL